MSALAVSTTSPVRSPQKSSSPAGTLKALATLSGRRFALSAKTPREILVPLLNPVFFALVIAPALAKVATNSHTGIDYMTFVAIATVGLLIPINCLFSGIGVIVDRQSGARRDLLAAPLPRALLVLGNYSVALTITAMQLVVLIIAASLRGAVFHTSVLGVLCFVAASLLLAIGMYGVAETLANKIEKQEEYIAAVPGVAILPFFFAGSLFPISVLPAALGAFAKVLPLTHALALMRYGLVDTRGLGLHEIWGSGDPAVLALRSLAVLAVFAAAFVAISIRVFTRSAVR
jgi:ABC-2 type transport system permease protein